ncbi:MAG: DUF5103 domain-containing protein [Prevotella sp.]
MSYIQAKYYFIAFIIMLTANLAQAQGKIFSKNVNTLEIVADDDFMSPPVITLDGEKKVNVSFDEMSHDYHRLIYHIEHCNPDWSTTTDLLESDFLEGFNDIVIDDYENSINTTVLYTHYSFTVPNEKCQLKLSGNYRITVIDDDSGEQLLEARLMIVDQKTDLMLNATTNTDIDVNKSHQQLSMTLNYHHLNVTNPDEEIFTIVTQNERNDNMRINVRPTMRNSEGMEWSHNRNLIFDGGNEYRKFETLSLSHPTMGIDEIWWDGANYNAFPFIAEPRRNYVYDVDANGAFYIRNSDNSENETTCDYVYVNYRLKTGDRPFGNVVINGKWTNHADKNLYVAKYNDEDDCYSLRILQKQGYYSYQYLFSDNNGNSSQLESEGNFHETENKYQAYVYFKGQGQRYWQLVGYRQLLFK